MRLTLVVERALRPARERNMKYSGLALALLLALLLPPAAAPAHAESALAQAPAGASWRLRIGVVKDGITVIAPTDLANAGVDPATVDPRDFAMSSMGKAVAIWVTGEDDGRFDGNDRVYFFGEKFRSADLMQQKYTDERAYWLDTGGPRGLRMSAPVDATPQGNLTPPTDFATTLRAERSQVWWSLYTITPYSQDTWFWARLSVLAPVITTTLPYTVPYPAPAPATLRLEEVSNAYSYYVNPDHRTVANMNGVRVIDAPWDGYRVGNIAVGTVPAGALTHGVNNVDVGAWLAPGVSADDIYVNYWELSYRRLFRAYDEQLDFKAEAGGPQEYEVGGWTASSVLAWDVTNPETPVRLNVPAAAGADLTVRYRVDATVGNRYWLQGESTVRAPASVRLRLPTGLRSPVEGADSVIVTSAALRPEAERLAKWHRLKGRRALVVDFMDAVDEFNDGIYNARAVQTMMKWAAENWPKPAPAYLTLFGDGHFNFKNDNLAEYPVGPNQVPPYLAFVDPWQGEVAVDGRFGDLNGDLLPEVAVGRIAVNTLNEAKTVVDKIINYDEGPRTADWQRRALFVADNADTAGNFPAASDEAIASFTPTDLTPTRVYLPPVPASPEQVQTTRAALINAFNEGALMVQYTGHGAPERWTHEQLFTTADVPLLTNGARLPVVMTFNCLDGYFIHPTRVSMAETMQRQPNGGSIAALSPTGLGTTQDQQAFRKVLLNVIFKDHVRDLGRALMIAKQQFADIYGTHYLTQTMTLFGDPAMKMAGDDVHRTYLPVMSR